MFGETSSVIIDDLDLIELLDSFSCDDQIKPWIHSEFLEDR